MLDGSSGEQLARCGLYTNCIQGISRKSRLQSPEKIIAVLKNAEKVYSSLDNVAKGDLPFDDDFLRSQHAQLLEGEFDNYTCEFAASLIPMGKYRQVPCIVQHHRSSSETHFCLAEMLQQELLWFFEQAGQVLNDPLADPFQACAWLQHSYLRIHPFGDGNGRLGRMISSLPLIKAGLPPVHVAVERKFEYFDALMAADGENDIDVLATFLQSEIFHALDLLLKYVAPPTRSVLTPRGRGRGRGRRDRIGQSGGLEHSLKAGKSPLPNKEKEHDQAGHGDEDPL